MFPNHLSQTEYVTFQQKFQVSSKKLSPPYDVVQIKKQVTLFELSRGIVTPDNQVVMFAKLTFKLDKKKIKERNYLVRSRTTNSFIILETINRSIVGAEYTQENVFVALRSNTSPGSSL